jgi:hypothetical protein
MKSAEDLARAYARSLPVQAMVNSDLTPEHFYHAFLAGEAAGFQRGLEAAAKVCDANTAHQMRIMDQEHGKGAWSIDDGEFLSAECAREIRALSQPGAEEKRGEG